jgi:hypothetical protein
MLMNMIDLKFSTDNKNVSFIVFFHVPKELLKVPVFQCSKFPADLAETGY